MMSGSPASRQSWFLVLIGSGTDAWAFGVYAKEGFKAHIEHEQEGWFPAACFV